MTEVDKHYRQWVHERGKIGNYRNLSFSTTIREAFRAGYAVNTARIAELEAAEPKWIPYKEGDSLDEGEYYVTIRANSGQIYARHKWFRWGDWNGLEQYETVTHVIQLPTPFVPEVSDD